MGMPFSDILVHASLLCGEPSAYSYMLLLRTTNKDGQAQQMGPDPRNSVPVPLDESPIQVPTAMIAKAFRYTELFIKLPP